MNTPTLKELLEAGVHFGHRVNKWNPRMSYYIFTQKEGIHILDLEKTLQKLKEATDFLKGAAATGGTFVFLSTKRQVEEVVKEEAQRSGSMYLTSRWVGGLFTNFEAVSKSIRGLSELEEKRKVMEEQGYTKREQVLMDKKLEKLNRVIGGIRGLDKLPSVLFIVDSHKEDNAVREARKMGVKVVALTDTNGDPNVVDYPIPANDDAMKSVSLLVKAVADAIEEGRKLFEKKTEKENLAAQDKVEEKTKEALTEQTEEKVKVKKKSAKKEKELVAAEPSAKEVKKEVKSKTSTSRKKTK